ncbi:hypothetical protein BTR14_16935 [Rhizobium rhizosphaerae]|uniref:Oxidoreductase molybdopterin-binding domain-containing protein n=1 Tax=Xaviernesmea rhizosphaerae TaxID=1672749 RepID=A0ABX3PAV5_9HYPH|nr:molybdopterin-dependent oxidoreductase [Xaviernesmea rhizosphaerae]OQP85048.1 hypothetical protein BTR14_16935 [Xaviernesmea rhizosphaerae]
MVVRRAFLFGLAASLGIPALGAASARADETILTLRDEKGTRIAAQTLAEMDALPQQSFRTTTPWHKGVVEFSGVTLKAYLDAAKVSPEKIRFVALNDYVVDADVASLIRGGALLATRQNGVPLPVSDKGPVFVIFNFDANPELHHQFYLSRAVWQLAEIDISQ